MKNGFVVLVENSFRSTHTFDTFLYKSFSPLTKIKREGMIKDAQLTIVFFHIVPNFTFFIRMRKLTNFANTILVFKRSKSTYP